MKRLRYASDVHLEINAAHAVPHFIQGVEDEMMVFAGDTTVTTALRKRANDAGSRKHKGKFKALLEQITGFDKVFFLMGNHEHYRGHFQDSAAIMREFIYEDAGMPEDKFFVLDNDAHDLNESTILVGATLWTDMRRDNPDAHWLVGRGMNDFRLITYGDFMDQSTFTTYHAVEEHRMALAFIKKVAVENRDKRIIVATHHAPSYQSNGRAYNDSMIIDGYCSDLEDFILDHPNISDWIHGHTHVNVEYKIGQCRITSNMRGYVGYDHNTNFTADQFLEKFIEV